MIEQLSRMRDLEDYLKETKVFKDVTATEEVENANADNDALIETLELSTGAQNALKAAGIVTISDLAARTKDEVSKVDSIGATKLKDIEEKLNSKGFTFAE
jgi:DNA-directed RNA polymerase alpha subunit